MARRKDKEKAIELRIKGLPYSEIRKKLGVSKSTLSIWLRDYPLTREQINELRGNNPKRIERFRETMKQKKVDRWNQVYKKVEKNIGDLSDREVFIAGFFLYWAEGGKTKEYSISMSNTDPSMLRMFIRWLVLLDVPREKIKVRIQLYKDMDVDTEEKYWSSVLGLPRKRHFRKSYIKSSNRIGLTYVTRGHGTCNIIVDGRDVAEYVLQGIRYVSSNYV